MPATPTTHRLQATYTRRARMNVLRTRRKVAPSLCFACPAPVPWLGAACGGIVADTVTHHHESVTIKILMSQGNERQNEHWCYHYPMQIGPTPEKGSFPTSGIGAHKCNTQTTTLIIGQLSAHLFSSTAIPEFPGYQGIRLCKIWPPSNWLVDWTTVPAYGERILFSLASALSRDIPPADSTD
jgi:hypothetical protein